MKSGKWIYGLSPLQPTSQAAQFALEQRLAVVPDLLRLAARKPEEDIEYVHQLRVATRRTSALLDLFASVVPTRRSRRLRRGLRDIRRAAGAARDLDVLAEKLPNPHYRQRLWKPEKVRKFVARARKQAQQPLVKAYETWKEDRFQSASAKLIRRVRWRSQLPEVVFVDYARNALCRGADTFFAAAAEDLSRIDAVHQLRIAGKQLRYAMEAVAGAFDPLLRDTLYPILENVQERLGKLNDHATAHRLFQLWCRQTQKASLTRSFERLAAHEAELLTQEHRELLGRDIPLRIAELKVQFDALLETPSLSNEGSGNQDDRDTPPAPDECREQGCGGSTSAKASCPPVPCTASQGPKSRVLSSTPTALSES